MLEVGEDVTPRDPKLGVAMKTSNFQKYIGGTAAYMKRLDIATKGCDQLTTNDTYFSDSWFSSVKTAKEMAAAVVDYFGPVKMIHKVFLTMLEKLMKDWPGESYLFMKSTPRFPGERTLLSIGYK